VHDIVQRAFLLRNRRGDRAKILYGDRSGFWLRATGARGSVMMRKRCATAATLVLSSGRGRGERKERAKAGAGGAKPPSAPIAKGLPAPGLLAHVIARKHCDPIPSAVEDRHRRHPRRDAREGPEEDARGSPLDFMGEVGWWAHARRNFVETLPSDPVRARVAIEMIRPLCVTGQPRPAAWGA
jgi:hypothetical protein